jgi:RimJ/RimL family protein N-acetyltransferase
MRESLQTDRLLLHRWRESDRIPFQAMNADPRVMEFMPALLSAAESDALFDRAQAHFDRHGFGPFAVELLENHSFIGFIGLSIPTFDAPFMPAVEIGWRLAFNIGAEDCD